MRLSQRLMCTIAAVGLGFAAPAHASYTLATSSCSINTNGWCLEGSAMSGFLAAILDPNNFGPTGTVTTDVTLSSLNSVSTATLSGANGFISTWWNDAESAPSVADVITFFQNGGDLILYQDDTSHDGIGEALGLPTLVSNGSVSNGTSPLFSGPFGSASNVTQAGNTGAFSLTQIAALNGTVGSLNANGEATSVYWNAGQFAPGAGKLVIIGDVDMVSVFGATYAPLNNNGRFGLNSIAYLISGNTAAVPEPSTWLMLIGGFGLVGGTLRRQRRAKLVRLV
jgi:PEP-CTERM motif